jgi:hypothetical protein
MIDSDQRPVSNRCPLLKNVRVRFRLRLGLGLMLGLGIGLRLGLGLRLGSAKVEVLLNTIGFYLQ